MELKEFKSLVIEIMSEHKLFDNGWSYGFTERKIELGHCNYRLKQLNFSLPFIPINPVHILKDVILHETAHALAGPFARHSYVWKRKAIEVGARPESCQKNATSPEGKYIAECVCGNKGNWHRKPKYDVYRCAKCNQRIFVKVNNNVSSNARLISSILDGV